jgi:pyridoxamine 5'-phosphate oxidase
MRFLISQFTPYTGFFGCLRHELRLAGDGALRVVFSGYPPLPTRFSGVSTWGEQVRDLASWRREYEDRGLTEEDLGPAPVPAFLRWLDDAGRAGLHEPNAMVVATTDTTGAPSTRYVLLKGVDERGFVFYTNYESRKAEELSSNPACALLFPWHPLERQIRVEGTACRVSATESDAYFASRPRSSQLGAWASPQSTPVPDRSFLHERYSMLSDRFATTKQIPRPPYWGGFRVRPHRIEFWQGRPGRLHDRIRFERADDEMWVIERLAP